VIKRHRKRYRPLETLLPAIAALMLGACASVDSETTWHPTQTECTNHSPGESLLWWQDSLKSSASFRLAIDPDSGQGPTVLVILESGRLNNLGDPDDPPVFIGAVGDASGSCVVRMPWSQCPAARRVHEALRGQSIPLGFAMDSPTEGWVFHAPTYFLEFSDGQGNHNQWRFYGTDHPLQRVIDESIDSLESCWLPASEAFNGRQPPA
jgi:hypothetical protein